MDNQADTLYISDVAPALNRKPTTIRDWERRGILPKELRSKRSDRGWRYWTSEQVDGIKKWMIEADMRPGKGLPHYNPTPEQLEKHLEGQRKPRKTSEAGDA